MSSEEAEKDSTESDSDKEAYVTSSMIKSSKEKKIKKFDFVIEVGRHIHLSEEQINNQKKLEEEAKAEVAKQEGEVRKVEQIDLLDPEVDVTYEVIPNFEFSYLHLGEWKEVMKSCPYRKGKGWQTIYDQIQTRINYLHTTEAELGINLDIPLTTKRLKSSVQYGDHLPGTVLNKLVLGPRVNDHAITFSSLLLVEVDKRNLNLLKQIRTIEQLRQ
uniref:Uncharacterized protein n=1 Tax=Tanacetum cinerariifolium TaxID=118510 RepID=A0A6L2LNY6_TANCI|nr:hypothetical protein [Tanacetum cinerariifolium]